MSYLKGVPSITVRHKLSFEDWTFASDFGDLEHMSDSTLVANETLLSEWEREGGITCVRLEH